VTVYAPATLGAFTAPLTLDAEGFTLSFTGSVAPANPPVAIGKVDLKKPVPGGLQYITEMMYLFRAPVGTTLGRICVATLVGGSHDATHPMYKWTYLSGDDRFVLKVRNGGENGTKTAKEVAILLKDINASGVFRTQWQCEITDALNVKTVVPFEVMVSTVGRR
jgi:hypothetical protein